MNDTTWFWKIVDAHGLAEVSSDEPVALREILNRSHRAEAEIEAISAAIGSPRFMDPPDGGDVPLAEQVKRMREALTTAELQRDEALEALRPFAKAAEDCGVEDDLRIGVVKPADVIWESAVAVSITYAHVDRARSALENSKAGLADATTNDPASPSLSSLRKGAEDQLRAALQLAKDMFIANNLSLPHTFEVIDAALVSGSREEQADA